MRIVIDIVHPAHVHFYRHLIGVLTTAGHQVTVASRAKEMTLDLLDHYGIPHVPLVAPARGGLLARGVELARRDLGLARLIRRTGSQLVLTRNPAGVQAARAAGAFGIFDTDDGRAVGIHFRAAYPFAHLITSPTCLTEDYGTRHRRYRGFKAMAYLHPNRFRPDPLIRESLGLAPSEPLFVVRFSAHDASHDRAVHGIEPATRRALLHDLTSAGRVVVSDEVASAPGYEGAQSVAPSRFHDVLAAADLCVGDSQSVAAEAAMLGTPSFRCSSFTGRVDYLRVLEEDYGLVKNYRPGSESQLLGDVRQALTELDDRRDEVASRHARLLDESEDVTAWYERLIDGLPLDR